LDEKQESILPKTLQPTNAGCGIYRLLLI